MKKILKRKKTGHSGTLDPKVTGNLIVCLDTATRLVKSQQSAGKEYVAVLKLNSTLNSANGFKIIDKNLKYFMGAVFQRPPLISAVKKELRIRHIYDLKLLEFVPELNCATFWCSVEAGT